MRRTKLNLTKLVIGLLFVISINVMNFQAHAQEKEYVTGKITYQSNGRCANGLWVEIHFDSLLKGRSLTGDDGRYYVTGLTPGSFELVVKRGESVLLRCNIMLPTHRSYDIQLGMDL